MDELPFAADKCPCVEKLRTVLPVIVGIRDGAVQMVSTLGSVVPGVRDRLSLLPPVPSGRTTRIPRAALRLYGAGNNPRRPRFWEVVVLIFWSVLAELRPALAGDDLVI